MRMVLFLLAVVRLSRQDVCDPKTCKLPDCRCFNDPNIPGKLQAQDTPQIVVVSFENNILKTNVDLYRSLFKNVHNPNGCPARGSFFIEDDYTNYDIVYELFKNGHEIGIHSVDGKTPKDNEWTAMYKHVLNKLASAGIDAKEIHGTRVPELYVGGNGQFVGMGNNNILYDTSCVNLSYSTGKTYLWPFTLDMMPVPGCDIGSAPSYPFFGTWEFMLADLNWDGRPCATPSACINVVSKSDSFHLFNNAFIQHYYTGKRSPFMMIVDPAFATKQDLLDGAIEFLRYIRAAYKKDTWIVTAYQALEWVRNPTPIANLTDFTPWKC